MSILSRPPIPCSEMDEIIRDTYAIAKVEKQMVYKALGVQGLCRVKRIGEGRTAVAAAAAAATTAAENPMRRVQPWAPPPFVYIYI